MNTLKLICVAVIQWFKQIGAMPRAIANATKQRRQQHVRDEREAERIDRICNPSKYRGK